MLDQSRTAPMIDFVSVKDTINKFFQVFFSWAVFDCVQYTRK